MKNVFLISILSILSFSFCQAQLNEISLEEFNNIKINEITLKTIYETGGDILQMKYLFGNDLIYQPNTSGPDEGIDFWNENIYFNFEKYRNDNYYSLSNIQVLKSNIIVSVKGYNIKIGDSVNVFGTNISKFRTDEDFSVIFTDKLTGSASLKFQIDEASQNIKSIEFYAFD